MSYVKCKDKRTGITYVYESESYWDKEKQQPRAHRKLIGKIDEATGEIVPTDGRGRHRKSQNVESSENTTRGTQLETELQNRIQELERTLSELKAENEKLKNEKSSLLTFLRKLVETYEA